MQPVANEKCDDVESASVQKQPGSTKRQKCYEATDLIFSHAVIILCMHLGEKGKPYSIFLHNKNLDPALFSHIIFLTLLGSVCWWIDNMVAIKKPLHDSLVIILALISFVMGFFLFVSRFPTSLPDSDALSKVATCCLNSDWGTLCSFIIRNYWLLEILFVLLDSLLIFAEGIVIQEAFSWWRLSREMKVSSKSP